MVVLVKNAYQSIADHNVLKILKHIRKAQSESDNHADNTHDFAVSAIVAPILQPEWHELSRNLLQKLSRADESPPDMKMPEYESTKLHQQSKKS